MKSQYVCFLSPSKSAALTQLGSDQIRPNRAYRAQVADVGPQERVGVGERVAEMVVETTVMRSEEALLVASVVELKRRGFEEFDVAL